MRRPLWFLALAADGRWLRPAPLIVCALGSLAHADDLRWKLPNVKGLALPESHLLGPEWYPAASIRLGEEASVLVEFAISPRGHATDISVLSPQSAGWNSRLDAAALRYLNSLEFDVPASWEASDGPKRKYRFSFVFLIRPCREYALCKQPPASPADYSVTVIAPPAPEQPWVDPGLPVFPQK